MIINSSQYIISALYQIRESCYSGDREEAIGGRGGAGRNEIGGRC